MSLLNLLWRITVDGHLSLKQDRTEVIIHHLISMCTITILILDSLARVRSRLFRLCFRALMDDLKIFLFYLSQWRNNRCNLGAYNLTFTDNLYNFFNRKKLRKKFQKKFRARKKLKKRKEILEKSWS